MVERRGALDELTLECEPADPATADEAPAPDTDRAQLRARLELLLRERTGLRIAVSVLDPGSVPRSEGKAVRVLDRRSVSA